MYIGYCCKSNMLLYNVYRVSGNHIHRPFHGDNKCKPTLQTGKVFKKMIKFKNLKLYKAIKPILYTEIVFKLSRNTFLQKNFYLIKFFSLRILLPGFLWQVRLKENVADFKKVAEMLPPPPSQIVNNANRFGEKIHIF